MTGDLERSFEAGELWKKTFPLDWRPYHLLGHLYNSRGAEARAEFQKIIAHRGRTFWVPFYPLVHLGLARVATASGDVTAAGRAYRQLFALWKDADPDLPVLLEARKEYESLRSR